MKQETEKRLVHSVHRFRDKIAVHLHPANVTVYLTVAEALALKKALNDCAKDIKAHDFVNSDFNTREF